MKIYLDINYIRTFINIMSYLTKAYKSELGIR